MVVHVGLFWSPPLGGCCWPGFDGEDDGVHETFRVLLHALTTSDSK